MEPPSTTERGKSSPPSPINTLPREILYYCLSLCHETYDIVKETTNSEGKKCLIVSRGSGSKNFGRVCRMWKTLIEAGMVLPTPFDGIQLTDEQFSKIVAEQTPSPLEPSVASEPDSLQLSDLRGYSTITIICKQFGHDHGMGQLYTPFPSVQVVCPKIPAPKQLNIVVTDGRTADIRPIFRYFQTSHKSIHDNLHEGGLASHEIPGKVGNISINVWDGRIVSPPPIDHEFVPSLEIPSGFGRADLYVNRWTDIDKIGDIPWVFGQLCRNARPHTLGFHLLSSHGSALTDQWHTQRPCAYPDNALLRRIHVTGISSDGFLRLLQCARIEIWCVRELKITLPTLDATHTPELCFWDFRIFDKATWPFTTDESGVDLWEFLVDDGDDLKEVVTFPRVALKRLVDGRIMEVEKESMRAPWQIASQHEHCILVGWYIGAEGDGEADIEDYAGRSLRWTSLCLVEVEGELTGNAKQQFEHLGSSQYSPSFVILGPQEKSRGSYDHCL